MAAGLSVVGALLTARVSPMLQKTWPHEWAGLPNWMHHLVETNSVVGMYGWVFAVWGICLWGIPAAVRNLWATGDPTFRDREPVGRASAGGLIGVHVVVGAVGVCALLAALAPLAHIALTLAGTQ